MGGVNTTQLLASTGDPIEQPVLVRGYVSTIRPAPVSFSEPVWVIVPGYSTDRPLGPCEWPAIHGASLPVQGAECVVGFDDQHVPTLVWWSGPRSIEPKPELVSVLPGSPVDGQEVYFQNTTLATEGVVWHLRYRAASSSEHKWEFVGGPAMQTGYSGNVEKKTEALQELTGGPKLTVPVTGEYDIGFAIRVEGLEAATRTITALPLVNGATGLKGVEFVCSAAGGTFFGATLGILVQRANLTAAQVLSAGILQTGTQAVSFSGASITLCPVRVG